MMNQNQLLDQLKMEVASELGITLGADTTSKMNGLVGGMITKRLIELGKQQLSNQLPTIQPYMINHSEQQNQLH